MTATTSKPQPKPWIMDIAPYVPGKSKTDDGRKAIKLSSNENPLGTSDKARAAFATAANSLERYPDASAVELREALAELHGLDAARIIYGNGSDEVLHLAAGAFAGAGDEIIYVNYGFTVYPIATKRVGATPVVAADADYATDVDAILASVTDRTRIVFVANPNNPTGTYASREEIARLHAGLRPDILLVLDHAYAEYIEGEIDDGGMELAKTQPNVLVTRTFSKLYGLAAERIGWGYGSAEVIEAMHRIRLPFSITIAGTAAAIAALHDSAFVEHTRSHNAQAARGAEPGEFRAGAVRRRTDRRSGVQGVDGRRLYRPLAARTGPAPWPAHHHRHRGGDARSRRDPEQAGGGDAAARDRGMKRFGIIGFGRFGQLAARHLRDHFSVVVTDTADVGEAAAAIGVKTGSLADAADCDVVMLAVPVQAMAATIAAIAPLVRPGALVLDVASVKMLPARWMLEALPESVDIHLLELCGLIRDDSKELFFAIQNLNPYAEEITRQFIAEANGLLAESLKAGTAARRTDRLAGLRPAEDQNHRARQCGGGADMVPEHPVAQIARPERRTVGAGRIDRSECVVERYVAHHRHRETAQDIERRAGEHMDRAGLSEVEPRDDGQPEQQQRRADEESDEERIDDGDVDRLHRPNAFRPRHAR
ncbi:aminotransferase class I and II domain-containing protein [Ditylenchus destructor]|uniref:Aminotransferase class I and II domain-containing protein n=1 Tax=Ditylenchus destructor TaxID=166010 RepID=A0AAD4QWR5_9BILA|nr:aminotransferase class I and II domain-containing protein [Ditylenchus destructor]